MPSIKDLSTIKAIAREYCGNGRDKAKAMRTIGYAESSCKSGKAVGDVYGNLRVIAEIKAIDDETAEKLGITRAGQHLKLQEAYKIAKAAKNPSAMTGAVREQNEMAGLHRDKAPNADKERAIAERMSSEDKELAQALAKIRTEQEANRPNTVKLQQQA